MFRGPLLPIFLIVLIDILGLTIVIPLLGFYAEHFGASPFVASLIVSVYAACSLLSSPILGSLSDKYGRKPVLIISQMGTCLGFLVLAYAGSLWLVFLGRILDGATAGNLSIAQAYVADHTKPENRTKSMGIIGVAFGIGFLIGPFLSGRLAEAYGLHAPFLCAAGLSFLSIICTSLLLKGGVTKPVNAVATDAVDQGPPVLRKVSIFDFKTFMSFFGRPQIAALLLLFFLFQFSFSLFTGNFALFAERRFTVDGKAWGPHEVGLLFAYTGFLGIVLQGGLLGRLVKRFGDAQLMVAGFTSTAISYALLYFGTSLPWIMVVATISSFGNGVLRPVITSQLTQVSGPREQGAVMGVSQSLVSIAMAVAPPIGGMLLTKKWLMPWALLMSATAIVAIFFALRYRKQFARIAAPPTTTIVTDV